MLTQYEIRIDKAENGREALDKIKANDYKVVFMDIQMPEMNDIEATRIIRKDLDSVRPELANLFEIKAGVATVRCSAAKAGRTV